VNQEQQALEMQNFHNSRITVTLLI